MSVSFKTNISFAPTPVKPVKYPKLMKFTKEAKSFDPDRVVLFTGYKTGIILNSSFPSEIGRIYTTFVEDYYEEFNGVVVLEVKGE